MYSFVLLMMGGEEPPETCRAIYRNKYIEKTLYLVACTLEICYEFERRLRRWKDNINIHIRKLCSEDGRGWNYFKVSCMSENLLMVIRSFEFCCLRFSSVFHKLNLLVWATELNTLFISQMPSRFLKWLVTNQ